MPKRSWSSVVPLSMASLLFLTFLLWVHCDLFRPSSVFSKESNVVSIGPSRTFCSIRSVVECLKMCSTHRNLCQAIIYDRKDRECRIFTGRFKRSTDVMPSLVTVYMERYPPLPSQINPVVNSACTTFSPKCMFLSAHGTIVAIVSSVYSVYSGPSTLTSGSLVANRPLSHLFVNYSQASVDSCVGFNSGRTVYIIKGLTLYCYEYQVSTFLKYEPCVSWTESLLSALGLVMGLLPPGPYIAQEFVTYLFQSNQIVDSNGTKYVFGLGSPFANYPSSITSVSETDDAAIYLMASSGHSLYAYYYMEKQSILMGNICA